MNIVVTLCNDSLVQDAGSLLKESNLVANQRVYGPGTIAIAHPFFRAPWVSGYSPHDVVEQGVQILASYLKEPDGILQVIKSLEESDMSIIQSENISLCWRKGPPVKSTGIPSTELVVAVNQFNPMTSMPALFAWSVLHEIVCNKATKAIGPMMIMTPMLHALETDVELIRLDKDFKHYYTHPDYRNVRSVLLHEESLAQFTDDIKMFCESVPALGFRSRWMRKVALPIRYFGQAVGEQNWEQAEKRLEDIESEDWKKSCAAYLEDMKNATGEEIQDARND